MVTCAQLFQLELLLLTLVSLFPSNQNLNSSGKPASNSEGPKFPGDKSTAPSNNNQQKKGIQVLPDGETHTHAHTHVLILDKSADTE